MRAVILTTFTQIAVEIAGKDFNDLAEGTRLSELAIDSLAMVEIIGGLERRLSIAAIPDERLMSVATVGDLLDVVEAHVR